jgi:hypothetical protein
MCSKLRTNKKNPHLGVHGSLELDIDGLQALNGCLHVCHSDGHLGSSSLADGQPLLQLLPRALQLFAALLCSGGIGTRSKQVALRALPQHGQLSLQLSGGSIPGRQLVFELLTNVAFNGQLREGRGGSRDASDTK